MGMMTAAFSLACVSTNLESSRIQLPSTEIGLKGKLFLGGGHVDSEMGRLMIKDVFSGPRPMGS